MATRIKPFEGASAAAGRSQRLPQATTRTNQLPFSNISDAYAGNLLEDRHVCQDILVPITNLGKTIDFFHATFECYPLWLCPHRTLRTEPQGSLKPSVHVSDYEMFVDVGAYGVPGAVLRRDPYDSRGAIRRMQDFVITHRGYQCLYAVTELTRDDYRRMFDCALYDSVRKKYQAEGVFMDTYDKVKR